RRQGLCAVPSGVGCRQVRGCARGRSARYGCEGQGPPRAARAPRRADHRRAIQEGTHEVSNLADRLSKNREVATNETPRQALNVALDKYRPQLQRALPAHMTVDRFISVVMGAVSKNPDIAECRPASILQAVGQAARMGLEIDV